MAGWVVREVIGLEAPGNSTFTSRCCDYRHLLSVSHIKVSFHFLCNSCSELVPGLISAGSRQRRCRAWHTRVKRILL